MRAIVQDAYGSADVLSLRDIDRPSPGPGEVLVRVRAAGADPGVWHMMTGWPYLMRVIGFGFRRPKVPVRGLALAGTVEAAGAGVTRFRPGDEVFGTCRTGSFAEYAVARADRLAAKPAALSFDQAAAVPVSGVTALQAVRKAGVTAGRRVLVIGAGGGIGTFAVQIAKARGARVTGVCGPAKADLVRSLGADDVIDYTRDEIDRDGTRYDVILDIAGNRPLRLLRRALAPRGTLVVVGGDRYDRALLTGMGRQSRVPLVSMLTAQRLRVLITLEKATDLEALAELTGTGAVTPVVDRRYPLPEAPDAIRRIATGHARGKTVVTV
jgi:NADPH:quinone reductase-like Zn-dependent oxidoreductase